MKVCIECLKLATELRRGRCPTCATQNEATRRPSARTRYPKEYHRIRGKLIGQPCHWQCGRLADTADHLVPVIEGGEHTTENLVPSCGPCNSTRGAQLAARRNRG